MLTPLPFFENNINGTVSILKVTKDEGVTRLVFSSTAAVYGNRAGSPLLIETLPRPPKNPYGQSKLMAEMILEACVKPNNLQPSHYAISTQVVLTQKVGQESGTARKRISSHLS